MTDKRYSLKGRLLAALLGAVALVWLATAVYSYYDTRHEVNELLDAHLAQSASMIVAQMGHELEEIDLEHAPDLHDYVQRVSFQVWEGGKVLRLHSLNAPAARMSPVEHGFSHVSIEGEGWRVFSTWDDGRKFLVQVGERDQAREEIAAGVARNLLVPLAFALPALGLLVWLGTGRALAPLRALRRQVEDRAPDKLAPLAAEDAPDEVVPLVRGLNALFGRVAGLLERERRFTADAAHELRTPLAALKTQAQVARGAGDDAERSRALDNVVAGSDRAARLVEQLLTLARLEPDQLKERARPCDLRAIAQRTVAELAPGALARGTEIELDAGEETGGATRIEGHPELIAVLLRNLIDNAVRYGGSAGASVRVGVRGSALEVSDQGPGIPPEARARVTERFYRLPGTEPSGSGLGLSIVERIAAIHGAKVSLGEGANGKGLRVTVAFPDARG